MGRKRDRIDQYCDLVRRINKKNDYLDKEESKFYSGGHTFEEVYEDDLEELKLMKNRLESIMRTTAKRMGGFF